MALTDEQVEDICYYVDTCPRTFFNGKFIANHVQIRIEDVAFVLKELHFDGELTKNGTYYARAQ